MSHSKLFTETEISETLNILHTPAVASQMKQLTVGIAGLGGLGSNAAVSLARAGIGKLVLVDFDRVELSNLNRQAYLLEHVEMLKTEAIADIIRRINPFISIKLKQNTITEQNCMSLFKNVDIVIEAVDGAETKAIIIETILTQSETIPVIAGSGMAGYGKNSIIKEIKMKRLILLGDNISEVAPGVPLMAPRVCIVANMQANAALEILLGEWK
ncbi:MAG: sulfur carrier protein ThiS adenylyltransferase ThiF [Spirochaetia bacterium]|jgi:sulfur carrier protein ThiS adenylyltransferase|nr:sulfur carrier protein ThiS adenylyltransferase ThiF [Spirochaetia bacterium]